MSRVLGRDAAAAAGDAPRPPALPACRSCIISRVSISASSAGLGGITRPREAGRRRIVDLARRHLLHAAMRDVDLDGAGLGAALDARAELVALVRRVEDVDVLADRARAGSPAGSRRDSPPSRFPSCPDCGLLHGEHEPVVRARTRAPCSTPARACALTTQPALVAGAHDLGVGVDGQDSGLLRPCRHSCRGEPGRRRDRVTIVVLRRRQVGRQFERGRRAGRLVIDALADRAVIDSQPASAEARRRATARTARARRRKSRSSANRPSLQARASSRLRAARRGRSRGIAATAA